jgi:hypothetical protein
MPSLILIAWLTPILCMAMILGGALRARRTGERTFLPFPTRLIIQITTVGNESTVNEIIRRIRGYELDFPHEIWVATEPWASGDYQGADEVIVVPKDFNCRASYKARALDYTRRLRVERGLNDFYVKVLFLDDDCVPTKSYVEKVFRADYDVCEGIPTPRTGYGRFLSHMDDLRTINCLYLCSVFQGIGHPVHVHGEGLCVRGTAESLVTWDYEMFASEDLVFGHMAAFSGVGALVAFAGYYFFHADLERQRDRGHLQGIRLRQRRPVHAEAAFARGAGGPLVKLGSWTPAGWAARKGAD